MLLVLDRCAFKVFSSIETTFDGRAVRLNTVLAAVTRGIPLASANSSLSLNEAVKLTGVCYQTSYLFD